jgi:hypothetical protein
MAEPFRVSPFSFSVGQTQTVIREIVRVLRVTFGSLAKQGRGLFRFTVAHHCQSFSKLSESEKIQHDGPSGKSRKKLNNRTKTGD